jgi:peptide deformylase
MQLAVLTDPHPVLRTPAGLIDPAEIPSLTPLILDMFETLTRRGGVGLAAPQVGQSKSLFVVQVDGQRQVFINPVILAADQQTDAQPEGCLSLPGLILKVPRSIKIKVMFRDASGEQHITDLQDAWARIFLHEFDHLQGIMIDDRVGPVSLDLAKRKVAKQQRKQRRQVMA